MSDETYTEAEAHEALAFEDALNAVTLKSIVTPILIAINLAVFVLMVFTGVSFFDPSLQSLVQWGADFGPLTTNGEWWRLLTAAFVHIGFLHVLMNMYILWSVGVLTERLFGHVAFLTLYLVAGIGGNLVSLYWQPLTVAAGASGAVFGLYGGLFAFLLRQHNAVPQRTLNGLVKNGVLFLGYNVIYGITQSHVDMAAHFGGLVTGFLAGSLLALPLVPSIDMARIRRSLIASVIGGGTAAACLVSFPVADPIQAAWYRGIFMWPSVTIGSRDRVVYSGASRKDAEALGQSLKTVGFFQDLGVEVAFSKQPRETTVSIPLKDGFWEDPVNIAGFEEIGRQIAPAVGGVPITIHLLNGRGTLERQLSITEKELIVGKNDKIYYSGSVNEGEASALGRALVESHFFSDNGAMVRLHRGDQGTVVSIRLKDGAWDDPAIHASLFVWGRGIAASIGGLPIRLHEIGDNGLDTSREIVVR